MASALSRNFRQARWTALPAITVPRLPKVPTPKGIMSVPP